MHFKFLTTITYCQVLSTHNTVKAHSHHNYIDNSTEKQHRWNHFQNNISNC